MHLEGPGPIPLDDEEAAECIRPMPTFVGANLRKQVMTGDAEAMRPGLEALGVDLKGLGDVDV